MHDQHNRSSRRKKRLAFIFLAVVLVATLAAGVVIAATGSSKDTPQNPSTAKKVLPAQTKLYVDPQSQAAVQAAAWRTAQSQNAQAMDKLAALPTAKWFTSTPSLASVNAYVAAAAADKAVPVLAAYNIPLRDCGQYSAGGAKAVADYKAYIGELASRIGTNKAIIILEPDALAGGENQDDTGKPCLTADQKTTRYQLLSDAIVRLKKQPNTLVYLDGGNSGWIKDTAAMAELLRKGGVAKADGFSLNVSNFHPTDKTIAYGQAISKRLQGKHFVIDSSRNGNGAYANAAYPEYNWCNPPERALGHYPTTDTGIAALDAYLYIKYPGESDGQDPDAGKCFGGLQAGQWMPDYAVGLIARWPQQLQP